MDLGALRFQVVPKTQTNWYVPPLGYAWGGGGPGVAVWGRVGLSGGGCLADEKKRTPPLCPFYRNVPRHVIPPRLRFFRMPYGHKRKTEFGENHMSWDRNP